MKKLKLFTNSIIFIVLLAGMSKLQAQKHSFKFQFQQGVSSIENKFIVKKYQALIGAEYNYRFSDNTKIHFNISGGLISRIGLKGKLKNNSHLGAYFSILKNYTPTHSIINTDHFGNEIGKRKDFINYLGISVFYELPLKAK